MKYLRLILSVVFLGILFSLLAHLGVSSAHQDRVEKSANTARPDSLVQVTITPTISAETPSVSPVSLADLGYDEQVLPSPASTTEYTLRLPEGWQLRQGSTFELEISYDYRSVDFSNTEPFPGYFGDVIVAVDGQTQLNFPIREPVLDHFRLSVELPPSLLNDSARDFHSIEVILDARLICDIAHKASLTIHPTSFFTLAYEQTPITTDLALYPSPFYQQTFVPDLVRFVLPDSPTEADVGGAVVVAARLGNLTNNNLVISGTTDLLLLDRLTIAETEHLIIIGRPDSNKVIETLDQLNALLVSPQRRQASLEGKGPAAVAPGDILTYTLTLTNTTQEALSSLSLSGTLPDYTQITDCSPLCTQGNQGEVNWSIDALGVGESRSYTLALRLSDVITEAVIENTFTLFDGTSKPINVSTLTTIVHPTPPLRTNQVSSVSSEDSYFFVQDGRAVPEYDGIIQEIVSPWDSTKAILVITGLDEQAVYKASQAMSFKSHFPAMNGPLALVRTVHPAPESALERQATSLTLADLGYTDASPTGFFQSKTYRFDIPLTWELTQTAYFELHFSHSRFINYESSSLSVLFNRRPVTTIGLNEETSQGGTLRVDLPSSLARPGETNRIDIEFRVQPLIACSNPDLLWTMIKSDSLLHLAHSRRDSRTLDLDSYPIPFDQQPDLSDMLFVLPELPQPNEWEKALQLSAALGSEVDGLKIIPLAALGKVYSETELSNYHIITIGRPSRNSILQQVNVQLPQPFLPDADQIEQKLDRDEVVLRLPPDVSLGYLQLIPSPWNANRGLLAVTGTSDEGVAWASQSLIQDDLRGQLEGNLALIRRQELQTLDTRQLLRQALNATVSTAVPELKPVATVTPISASANLAAATATAMPVVQYPTATHTPPSWLMSLVIATVGTVSLIFVIAIWQALRRRNTRESYDHF